MFLQNLLLRFSSHRPVDGYIELPTQNENTLLATIIHAGQTIIKYPHEHQFKVRFLKDGTFHPLSAGPLTKAQKKIRINLLQLTDQIRCLFAGGSREETDAYVNGACLAQTTYHQNFLDYRNQLPPRQQAKANEYKQHLLPAMQLRKFEAAHRITLGLEGRLTHVRNKMVRASTSGIFSCFWAAIYSSDIAKYQKAIEDLRATNARLDQNIDHLQREVLKANAAMEKMQGELPMRQGDLAGLLQKLNIDANNPKNKVFVDALKAKITEGDEALTRNNARYETEEAKAAIDALLLTLPQAEERMDVYMRDYALRETIDLLNTKGYLDLPPADIKRIKEILMNAHKLTAQFSQAERQSHLVRLVNFQLFAMLQEGGELDPAENIPRNAVMTAAEFLALRQISMRASRR